MTFSAAVMARRRKGIGASEVPAIAELSPWQSPMDVYLAKQPDYAGQEETEAMRNGHRMEPVILSVFAKETGLSVKPNRRIVWDRAPGSRLFCTPDAFVIKSNRLVQAKNVGPRMAEKWGSQDEPWQTAVPEYVIAQIQAECAATGAEGCHIATCIQSFAGLTWPCWYIPADLEMGADIRRFATDWYNDHVLAKRPPEGTAVDHANLTLHRIRTGPVGPLAEASPEWETLVTRLVKLRAAKAFVTKREEQARNTVFAMLGEHTGGVDGLLSVVTRRGAISYKDAVTALCPGADLEPFRGTGSPQIKLAKDIHNRLGIKKPGELPEETP